MAYLKNLLKDFLRNLAVLTVLKSLCFSYDISFALTQADEFFTCIDARKKWSFSDAQCFPGRVWKRAPANLINELDRPLYPGEVAHAIKAMKMESKNTVAKSKKPQAIIIIGAGGAGKSVLCESLDLWFPNFKLEEYIQFDGDILRRFHRGFVDAVRDPSVGYVDAWKVLKPHIFTTKDEIFHLVVSERRNVIIPTNVHAQKYYKLMLENGYDVIIVGVYVDFKTALYRGKNRAEWTGRIYLGTEQDWKTGIEDMYSLASAKSTFRSIILDNSDFKRPRILFNKPLLSQR